VFYVLFQCTKRGEFVWNTLFSSYKRKKTLVTPMSATTGKSAAEESHVVEQESKGMTAEEKIFYDAALASLDKESRVRVNV
jgi:hypothetical protein